MTRIPKTVLLLLGLPIVLAEVTSRTATADIIYREIFPNDTQGLQALGASVADTGWRVHVNSTGSLLGPTSSTHGVGLGFRPGANGNLPALNSSPASNETNIGYLYTYTVVGYAPMLFTTEEFVIDRDAAEIDQFRWRQDNDVADAAYRVAIRIGGAWFTSNQTFTNPVVQPSTVFSSTAVESVFSFTTIGSAWHDLSFVPGSTLSRASSPRAASLPGGDVTAFGLYVDQKLGESMKFDNFEVYATPTAVPEPSSLILLGIGALGVCSEARRRRRLTLLSLPGRVG